MLELARPLVDVRADALAYTLDEPGIDPLAQRTRRVAGVEVDLRLLGSGHQVIAGPVIETVAPLDGLEGPLPYQLRREVAGWSVSFTADVYRRDYADFTRAVAFLRRYLSGRDDTLAAGFPGQPDALSGVMVRQVRRGIEWRAWHTFPATRQIVSTRSRMLIG
ncbi:hypothetical protein GCM10027589_12860 [Actinocorallia lasiicapitis]